MVFQSPRSGKFESNPQATKVGEYVKSLKGRFNPLDRGNLNQMRDSHRTFIAYEGSFNPLDRGNLNQIPYTESGFKQKIVAVSIP